MKADELRRVVGSIASTEVGGRVESPREPLADDAWTRLVAVVRAERLEPQLGVSVGAGVWPATTAQAEEAEALHSGAMATAVLLDRQLVDVAAMFAARSIDFLVLKGPAVAHLDYPDPAHRAYGDIDLLVPAHDIDTAVELLGGSGGRRAHREPRPGFDRRFSKGASFRMPSGLEVDVHRTLALGPFGLAIDLDALLAAREPFDVGGQTIHAPDRSRRFLHACLHAVLGRARPRLVPLIDLVLTAPKSAEEQRTVVALARRWQADAVVHTAVSVARARLGWNVPAELSRSLDALNPTARQRRWMRAYSGDGRSSARLTLTAVEAVQGWRNRVDYVHAIVWPSDQPMAAVVRRLAQGAASLRPRPGSMSQVDESGR